MAPIGDNMSKRSKNRPRIIMLDGECNSNWRKDNTTDNTKLISLRDTVNMMRVTRMPDDSERMLREKELDNILYYPY